MPYVVQPGVKRRRIFAAQDPLNRMANRRMAAKSGSCSFSKSTLLACRAVSCGRGAMHSMEAAIGGTADADWELASSAC